MTFSGKDGCPCMNVATILASLPYQHCQIFPSGDTGLRLTVDGSCVPFSYGASQCLQHDLLGDTKCAVDLAGERVVPPYCFRPWCYVDFETCRKESDVRAFRSAYFPIDSGINLFYSYATCNSTAEDWFEAEGDAIGQEPPLGGISISASVPTYLGLMMYKRNAEDEILASVGPEYFDDSIPFEGVYLKYVDQIKELSNDDIRSVSVTHRTRASSLVHPTSSFTAAVQDIKDGLIDMSIGPFWITAQRLKLSAFTLPIAYDETVLVIPVPKESNDLIYQVNKVMAPFSWGLWGIILGIIVVTSFLSLWFKDRTNSEQNRLLNNKGKTNPRPQGNSWRRSKRVYARLALDEFLEKSLFFCSAGVDQDESSSLPVKLLLFGFGFFILIAVSAYVANLAAFLVMTYTSADVTTMADAVAKGVTICAHPATKNELENKWPKAKFYFHENAKDFLGMLEDYGAGECQVMAVGSEGTSMNTEFLQGMCDSGLVFTKEVLVDTPLAFPIRSDIASGFSYWMEKGKDHGITLNATKEMFRQDAQCNVHYTGGTTDGIEQDQISEMNLILPVMIFVICSVIAVVLHLIHLRVDREGNASLLARPSRLVTVSRRGENRAFLDLLDASPEDDDSDEDKEEAVDGGIKTCRVTFGTNNTNEDNEIHSSKMEALRRFSF